MTSLDELDRLYALPLAEFTARRNELAKELGKAGDRDAANEVKALAKPSISAWAVNQLARGERMQIRSLLTASEQVREAQAAMLGGGDAEELRDAVARQREVVGALLESAKGILRDAGHPASEPTLERIRKTLTAVALDEEGRRLVEAGRLSDDLEPSGFGGLAPVGSAPPATKKRTTESRKRKIAQAEAKLQAAQSEAAEARERVNAARAEAREAYRAADRARRSVEDAEAKLERVTKRVDEARGELERARS